MRNSAILTFCESIREKQVILQVKMKNTATFILTKILGWKIVGEFPHHKKSVVIFAPHTSYIDGFLGKLYMMTTHTNYKFLSKKELFRFPQKYVFRLLGFWPVYEHSKYINDVVTLFNNNDKLHLVICPEGQRAKTDRWKKGFFYMAINAKVPVVVGFIDYKKKELGIKGEIVSVEKFNDIMLQVNDYYKNVTAKYPERFSIDKRFSNNI
mgnify:CR=1 FL=1